MKKNYVKQILLFFLCCQASGLLQATVMSYTYSPPILTVSDLENGKTLSGILTLTLNTSSSYVGSSTQMSIGVIHANDFTNGSTSVGYSSCYITLNSVTGTSAASSFNYSNIALGSWLDISNNALLANCTGSTLVLNFNICFLLPSTTDFSSLPTGTYSSTCTMDYHLYNPEIYTSENILNFPITFILHKIEASTLTLSTEAQTVNLSYTTPSVFQNGTSVSYAAGLMVDAYYPYLVYVKGSQDLTNGGSSIPLSSIKLTATQDSTDATYITTSTVSLSNTNQTIISSTNSSGLENKNYFDLKYYTDPNDENFLNRPAGTYTSIITFSCTPQ